LKHAKIRVRGAAQHNLRGVDIDLPKNSLIVFTGVSGSGKSSLAFDTLFVEGQRRYVESLSTYASPRPSPSTRAPAATTRAPPSPP
jgi:excinuclease ABC subunit A